MFEDERARKWELPKECNDQGMLALAAKGPISLDDPEVSSVLFKRFRTIRTIDHVKTWQKNFGFLHQGIYSASDVWKLARTVQWICNFHDLIKYEQVPFIRKALKRTSKLQRFCSKITEEEFYALQDRVYADDGASMRKDVSTKDLVDWMAFVFAEEKPNEGFCSFPPPIQYKTDTMYKLANDFLGVGRGFVSEIHCEYIEEEYADLRVLDSDEEMMRAARRFLVNVLNHLVGNLRISIKLDSTNQLEQSVSRTTPWEAILSEILKLISGKAAPRKCIYGACGKIFVPTRADQQFCGNPACRQSVSRMRRKKHSENQILERLTD